MINLVMPHTDMWLLAFDRQGVQPNVVLAFESLIRARAMVLAPWVRPELLSRTRDGRQFARLHAALNGFANVQVSVRLQTRAAELIAQARAAGPVIPNVTQALAWSTAERLHATLWTRDRRWLALQTIGCPVVDQPLL